MPVEQQNMPSALDVNFRYYWTPTRRAGAIHSPGPHHACSLVMHQRRVLLKCLLQHYSRLCIHKERQQFIYNRHKLQLCKQCSSARENAAIAECQLKGKAHAGEGLLYRTIGSFVQSLLSKAEMVEDWEGKLLTAAATRPATAGVGS